MSPERWRSVQELFSGALEEPGSAARAAFLARRCGTDAELRAEVESLLAAAEEAGDFLEESVVAEGLSQAGVDPVIGSMVGPYRIMEELGRGGMGTVYRGVRDDGQYSTQVAVKLVKRGMDTEMVLERFRHERQVLAFLNHPAIARLLDGNSTADGRPYFVLELVEGEPITAYCRKRSLSLKERIGLFQQVCAAVAYAHKNLIVHRDLKPENVLVSQEGAVKLLDFGIAKLLLPTATPHTLSSATGTKMLTPNYASPEQVRGEQVSTATDVYSLGVLLYEVLAGKKPYQIDSLTPGELERVVCREDPCPPSQAIAADLPYGAKALQGDLDNIVLKALQKEPAHRYRTVDDFAEDLSRYCSGHPVQARPLTTAYRVQRFVRRHKTRVMAAALISVALVGGAITTAWQARLAQQQRNRAEQRFEEVRRLANGFLVEGDTVAALPGGTAVRAKFIERALQSLDSLAHEEGVRADPSLQQELAVAYEKMGDAQGRQDGPNLGDTKGALASYRKAVAIREAIRDKTPKDRVARQNLAAVYGRLSGAIKVSGNYKQGLEYDQKALAVRQELLAESPNDRDMQRQVAANLTTLGGSLFQIGDWAGVLRYRREALALYQKIVAQGSPVVEDYLGLSLAYTRMGSIQARNHEFAEAVRSYHQGILAADDGLRSFPNEAQLPQRAATAWQATGSVYLEQGQVDQAMADFRKAQEIYAGLHARDPQDFRNASLLATSHYRIGQALLKQRNLVEAEKQFQTALDMRVGLAEKNPLNAGARGEVAESYASLGDVSAAAGRREQALNWYKKAQGVLTGLALEARANSATHQELARIEREVARLGK